MPMTDEQLAPYYEAYAEASLHRLSHHVRTDAGLEAVIRLARSSAAPLPMGPVQSHNGDYSVGYGAGWDACVAEVTRRA